jgi:hypothetical protein
MLCPTKETEAAVRAGTEYVVYRKTIDFEIRYVVSETIGLAYCGGHGGSTIGYCGHVRGQHVGKT